MKPLTKSQKITLADFEACWSIARTLFGDKATPEVSQDLAGYLMLADGEGVDDEALNDLRMVLDKARVMYGDAWTPEVVIQLYAEMFGDGT